MKRIFLIRHARPDVPQARRYSREEASQYLLDYDNAGIEPIPSVPELLRELPVQKIYCSTLRRSVQTARLLFGPDIKLVSQPAFREFERQILRLPPVRLPLRSWLVSSRMLWLMGFNSKGIESFRKARARARQAAQVLTDKAATENTVVLVAHGLLNAFVGYYLRRLGWRRTYKEGHGFLGITILTTE
jgi:broad specificity phosphatase PhoE